MANVNQLIETVVGQAIARPRAAKYILNDAAVTFAGLAADPRNTKIAQQLGAAAAQFATIANRPGSVSDFRDLLQETAQSYEEVGDIDNDMDLIARRAEIHDDRTRGLPRISITPKSVDEKTRLGDQATIKFNPSEQERAAGIKESNTLIQWQGYKEEAQTITIDYGLPQGLPIKNAIGSARFYGVVSYGSDGTIASVKHDIGNGTRLTVVGSYVGVRVAMAQPPIDLPGAVLSIGASMGFFAAPSTAPVMLTGYIDGLAATGPSASSELIQRPAHAALLLPMQSSLATGTATIKFIGIDANPTSPLYVVSWINSAQNIAIPLTNDVAFIQVVNTSGSHVNYFRLPFQLSL